MPVPGRAGAVAVALLALGGLTGCEVNRQFAAACTTSPPVPHQGAGFVDVDVEVPPRVHPGDTFTIRVDHMVGYPATQRPGSYPTGVLSVSGPVAPSGSFPVGQGLFGGAPYPNTLELTVTGTPGEQIVLAAESASSLIGTVPDGYLATCSPDGGQIVAIDVVAPDPGA